MGVSLFLSSRSPSHFVSNRFCALFLFEYDTFGENVRAQTSSRKDDGAETQRRMSARTIFYRPKGVHPHRDDEREKCRLARLRGTLLGKKRNDCDDSR